MSDGDGPADATSAWDEPPSQYDVLSSSDALGGLPVQDSPPPPPAPPPPPPPVPVAPVPPSTWLPTPQPGPSESTPQDIASTPPEYAPRPPLPSPTAAAPASAPSWSRPRPRRRVRGQTRSRTRSRVSVAAVAVVVLLAGVGLVTGLMNRRTSTPSTSSTPSPPLGPAVVVPASGVSVAPVSDPQRVRLELVAESGTKATVRYDSDSVSPTKLDTVALPWAVEAPLDAGNRYLSVSGSAGSTRGQRPVLVCRVLLDGVLVSESVSRGYASCDTSVDRFRTTRSTGDGVALASAVTVTPTATSIPSLPTTASTLTFEAYSSATTPTLTTRFGSSGTANKVEVTDQSAPFARRTAVPAGVDIVSMSASDYDAEPEATLLCRILLDGVPVETSVGRTSTSCVTSVRSLLPR